MIDILPFGPITDEDKKISWAPEHEIIMSMVGFEEAYECSITVRLSSDPVLDIKLSTMIRESGIPEARFDEILFRLDKLRQGIVEVGEKPL